MTRAIYKEKQVDCRVGDCLDDDALRSTHIFRTTPEYRLMYKVEFEASHFFPPQTDTYPCSITPLPPEWLPSMRIRLSANISHCLIDGVDSICLLVRNLNAEFLLDGHDDFDGVQAVQTEVVSKMRDWVDLLLSVRPSRVVIHLDICIPLMHL